MILGAMKVNVIINIILIIILVGLAGNQFYLWYMGRRSAKLVTNEEFNEGMRKAQIIDLREKSEFDASHIMGARNIPYSQFKTAVGGLRKDLPLYLYDQGKSISTRAAFKLHKQGYTDITILKTGFSKWDGKTKKR